jgi:sulfite exporter TauE/SafE
MSWKTSGPVHCVSNCGHLAAKLEHAPAKSSMPSMRATVSFSDQVVCNAATMLTPQCNGGVLLSVNASTRSNGKPFASLSSNSSGLVVLLRAFLLRGSGSQSIRVTCKAIQRFCRCFLASSTSVCLAYAARASSFSFHSSSLLAQLRVNFGSAQPIFEHRIHLA